MTETRFLFDPTGERAPAKRERLSRPPSLEGVTIGLLDISKARGDVRSRAAEKKARAADADPDPETSGAKA